MKKVLKPKLYFLSFSHQFSAITFLLLILANCVRDESCRQKLEPISADGSIIQDVAVNPALRCTP